MGCHKSKPKANIQKVPNPNQNDIQPQSNQELLVEKEIGKNHDMANIMQKESPGQSQIQDQIICKQENQFEEIKIEIIGSDEIKNSPIRTHNSSMVNEFDGIGISNTNISKLSSRPKKMPISMLDKNQENDHNKFMGRLNKPHKSAQLINQLSQFQLKQIKIEKAQKSFYFCLKTDYLHDYYKFMDLKQQQQKGQNQIFSTYSEWSKLLQKFQNQNDKLSVDKESGEKKQSMAHLFRQITMMKERKWYDEIIQLYKEKNSCSKNFQNIQGSSFDRKYIQIQEQFRWLISAIENHVFNSNQVVGAYQFPASRLKYKKMNKNSTHSKSHEMINSGESNMFFDEIPPSQGDEGISKMETISSGVGIFQLNLPDCCNNMWLTGFVWKGVYLRLISKKKAKNKLKCELKALKHLTLELLQNEYTFKTNDDKQFLNFLMPLISYTESSSWILYGTPIVFLPQEEQKVNNLVGLEQIRNI